MVRRRRGVCLSVAVREKQLRFPEAPVNEQPDTFFLSPGKMPCDPPMDLPTCKVVVAMSMLSLFGQLRCGYGF